LKPRSTKRHDSGPPGIVISALRGGSGKTILSIGITAALKGRGKTVAPFKKGPDYIDAGWLALAAGRPCFNLDTFLIPPHRILESYRTHGTGCDLAVVEGNRGLYDSIDTDGRTSTAELAKLLGLPVVLCIDCTKSTRTMAAVVAGCRIFDADVDIRAVVLNRVAGSRHETILRQSIETHCGVPVIGAVPKLRKESFPERHMGLVPSHEHDWAAASVEMAAQTAGRYLDLEAVELLASCRAEIRKPETIPETNADTEGKAGPLHLPSGKEEKNTGDIPRIGILRDSAFQFYYPENIEALEATGAEIVWTSPLRESHPPEVDALYIGGGFPETHGAALAENETYRDRIRFLTENGLPVYAECGGLMYLGRTLVFEDRTFPMAGVLPVDFGFSRRPQGHGYTIVSVDRENPFYPVGTTFRGHEFHYSSILRFDGTAEDLVFSMERGSGFQGGRDGVCRGNVLATYTHIHALGLPAWAEALTDNARRYRKRRTSR
jgi:cobyrinic acid a,c-diamide synthase